MKKYIPLLLVFILIKVNAQQLPNCDNQDWGMTSILDFNCNEFEHGEWVMVYEDEFNDDLDPDEWHTRIPWGNHPGDVWYTYNQPENQTCEGGKLKITVKDEPGYYPVVYYQKPPTYDYYLYTTDEVWTKRKYFYGKFEASLKIPNGPGFVPAFWLFGDCANEIDIFEFAHADTDHLLQTIHNEVVCGDDNTHKMCATSDDLWDFSTGFNKFTLEWDEFKIVFSINDNVVTRIDYRYLAVNNQSGWITDCINPTPGFYLVNPYFPENPLSVIFGVQIDAPGGAFYNANHANGPFPSSLEVEYLRVYKRSNPNRNEIIPTFDPQSTSSAITGANIYLLNPYENGPIVPEGQPVSVFATEKIVLMPGFKAPKNSRFSAEIVDVGGKSHSSVAGSNQKELPTVTTLVDLRESPEVFPNPTSSTVEIKFEFTDSKICLFNQYGELVYSCEGINNVKHNIDIADLTVGVYILKVQNLGEIFTRKLIKN